MNHERSCVRKKISITVTVHVYLWTVNDRKKSLTKVTSHVFIATMQNYFHGQQSTLTKCGTIELYYTNSNPNPNPNLNPDPKPNPIFILQLLYS